MINSTSRPIYSTATALAAAATAVTATASTASTAAPPRRRAALAAPVLLSHSGEWPNLRRGPHSMMYCFITPPLKIYGILSEAKKKNTRRKWSAAGRCDGLRRAPL